MTPTELLNQYLNGQRDFTWADLTGTDLTGTDLTGANLRWAHLTGANLTGANLTGADLTGTDLTGATRNDRKLLSSGSVGRSPSSGRTVTWLVYESGEPEIIDVFFIGTPAELRKAARRTLRARRWKVSAPPTGRPFTFSCAGADTALRMRKT